MTALLEIHDLRVAYGRRRVLHGLNPPPLEEGQVVALVGGNGTGKSTLLKALAGLQPGTGRVVLDGEDIQPLNATRRAGCLAYVPQALPQGSALLAYEAVLSGSRALPSPLNREQLERRLAGLFERLELTGLGLRPLSELSGGQRQMIGLVQALVRQPRLLLLDEPTSALDLRWQLKVLETVRDHCRERHSGALIALHDLNLALRFCDRMIVLHDGAVLAAGAPDSALNADILRRAYGVEGRVERCSLGFKLALADRALPINELLREPENP
ncbi:ABC transporter ATP-binding protein [Alcanivorax sp. 24]|uniref:ABC transporter ATP-binding protein n=1 Tax=Alcanivorax sp. 24 TaxID=2545266 RepID=UPI00105F33A8|nr:ABC transporter ATP-binding protein [Alcanivorax sp. 24]